MRSDGWERWPGPVSAGVREEHGLHVWSDRADSVVASVLRSAERHPEKEMVRDPSGALSYREFVEEARRMAARLQLDAGIVKGDRVALLLSNGVRFAVAVIAAQLAGAVAVPLNTKLRLRELEFEVRDSKPKALLVDEEWWPTLEPISDELAIPALYVSGKRRPGVRMLDSLLVRGATLEPVELDEHDPAFICYTSGTTGVPKGSVSTHFNCVNNFKNFAAVAGLRADDRTLVTVPMFHVTGLLAQTFLFVDVGASCVILPRYDPLAALAAVERERITHVIAAPTIYITMLGHPERDRFDVSSLRLLNSGSAPISPETVHALRKWIPGVEFQNAYGLTETSSIATANPIEEAIRKITSIGLPVPVTSCRTIDVASGRECEPGEPGELLIAGPQVVPGYWERPDATASSIQDGWLHTGDVASIDDEGYVVLLDRLKDMINRGGEKVYCVEVESVLFEHPEVLEAAVIGVPDPVYGEAVKAVVAPRAGAELDADDIRAFVGERLARFKVPGQVAFVEALPRNPNGKVMKSELRNVRE
jgi:long-chain acyl-CoA synthetase